MLTPFRISAYRLAKVGCNFPTWIDFVHAHYFNTRQVNFASTFMTLRKTTIALKPEFNHRLHNTGPMMGAGT